MCIRDRTDNIKILWDVSIQMDHVTEHRGPDIVVVQKHSALMLLVGRQEGHLACKKIWGDGGGGHWLVRMMWHPAGWSVFLPLLIFPYTIKSSSSVLAPAHPGGPRKKAYKMVVVWW